MQEKKVCLYHRVMRRENFEKAAKDLFQLVLSAQRKEPDKPRALYLDIDGHRNENGGFDRDMFELQQEFSLGFLLQFLEEIHMPLGDVVNTKGQKNDIPEGLQIFNADEKRDDSLEKLYIENYSNTEFMSEKEVYAYLEEVSDFLKRYNELEIDGGLDNRPEYDPMGWLFQWKRHMKEMIIELFNSFVHGNLISAAAMTRTLMECYVYFKILMEAEDEQLIDKWFVCSAIGVNSKNEGKVQEKIYEQIKKYCELRGISYENIDERMKKSRENTWLADLCGKKKVSFSDACEYIGEKEIYADFQYLCAFVHGQDVTTKLVPFLFYSSIYSKFYIMMTYIFKTIRLYSLEESMEVEIEKLEENLLKLSEII